MKIAARASAAQPFYAMSIGERAGILQAEGHSIAKLSLGEPDFGAPPAVREEMCRVMDGRSLPYSPALGLLALREAIAGFYRDRHGVEVDPARIVVTTGASSALLLVAAATTQPGDDVVIADPSYPCNRQLVETYGGRIVLAPTSPASRYQMDRAAAEAAWTPQTSAVMLATPSNPTGTSIPFEELESICALARERSAWRIVDEIYLGLADPGEDGTPARTVLETDSEAIVINSFSKYFGMTGWRLGDSSRATGGPRREPGGQLLPVRFDAHSAGRAGGLLPRIHLRVRAAPPRAPRPQEHRARWAGTHRPSGPSPARRRLLCLLRRLLHRARRPDLLSPCT